jgi:hypothetical protein
MHKSRFQPAEALQLTPSCCCFLAAYVAFKGDVYITIATIPPRMGTTVPSSTSFGLLMIMSVSAAGLLRCPTADVLGCGLFATDVAWPWTLTGLGHASSAEQCSAHGFMHVK